MTFAEIVDQIATVSFLREHTISDGTFSLAYRDIPERFEQIDRYFADHGAKTGSCFALECCNSVATALTLMFLLSRGYDCVLLPKMSHAGAVSEPPGFCHYLIKTMSFVDDTSDRELGSVASFLSVIEVNDCNDPHADGHDVGGRIFVRTSGSLGSPKLALYTHKRMLGNALSCGERLRVSSEDRIAIPVPIFHMYGLGAAWLPGFIAGASLDLQKNSNLLRYLDRERTFTPTLAFLTPSFCAMFRGDDRLRRHYRAVVVAGDRLKPESLPKLERRFGRVVNLYGSTEMGVIAAEDPAVPVTSNYLQVSTVGTPMPGVQLRLKNIIHGEGDEAGRGEIQCRHEYGFEGYVDDEGRTRSPMEDDWFDTGDLGRFHPGDVLEVIGRQEHSVNRDGRLLHFRELEQAMEEIDGVAQAVVVHCISTRRGQGIGAYCVMSAGVARTVTEVRQAARRRLPSYAVPDWVVILDALPVLPNGKVDRQALQRLAKANPNDFEKEGKTYD
jgi:acyl-CoA synthetase (AMP-forming)/AMP-acid ligase II